MPEIEAGATIAPLEQVIDIHEIPPASPQEVRIDLPEPKAPQQDKAPQAAEPSQATIGPFAMACLYGSAAAAAVQPCAEVCGCFCGAIMCILECLDNTNDHNRRATRGDINRATRAQQRGQSLNQYEEELAAEAGVACGSCIITAPAYLVGFAYGTLRAGASSIFRCSTDLPVPDTALGQTVSSLRPRN